MIFFLFLRVMTDKRAVTDCASVSSQGHKVSELAAILDKMNIVPLCGALCSGRACLSQLLTEYCRDKERKVF